MIRRRPTLPRSFPRSTIGAEELNCRVRDGNGCDLFAIATENYSAYRFHTPIFQKSLYMEDAIKKEHKHKKLWPSLTTY